MKNTILATVAMLISVSAFADVVKPPNTIDTAKGVSVVEGVQFNYTVDDRGWMTTAHIEQGNTIMEAQKTFLIRFESQENSSVILSKTIGDSLTKDATLKCQELGGLEYPGLIFPQKSGHEKVNLRALNFRNLAGSCTQEPSADADGCTKFRSTQKSPA